MLLDALALVLLALFVLLGARRGALAAGLSLAGLLVGYGAAFLLAPVVGPPLAAALGLASLLGAALTGAATIVLVAACSAIAGRALRSKQAEARGGARRSPWDRLGGACFGAVRGVLVVVLVGWLALWADAAAEASGLERPPIAEGSTAGGLARGAVESGVVAVIGDSSAGGRVTARVLARPRQALGDLRWLLEQRSVEALAADRAFWERVEAGAVDAALAQPSFRGVAADRELRQRLVAVGAIDQAAAADPSAFRAAAQEVLEALGPRLRGLREDPELHRLAADPEVLQLLDQGQVLGLLTHPGIQRLVARALSDQATL